MGETNFIVHVAIPCQNLEETRQFYTALGAREGNENRMRTDRVSLNFFNAHLVCHLLPEKVEQNPSEYPRHFGITFFEKGDFDNMVQLVKAKNLSFFKEPFTRWKDHPAEHSAFFIKDPANNIIEFKFYLDPEMRY